MVYRRSSLFISLVIHTLILIFAFYIYKNIEESKTEKKILIKLCDCTQKCSCSSCLVNSCKVKKPETRLEQKTVTKKEPAVQKIEPKNETVPTQNPVSEIVPQPLKKEEKEVSIEQKTTPIQSSQTKTVVTKTLQESSLPKQTVQPKNLQKEYIQTNLTAIRKLLQENLFYPLSARKRGIQGEVMIKFSLLKNGEIKEIIVTKESKEILNDAAVKTVESLSKKLPLPADDLILEVPIKYKLHEG